MTDPLMQQLLEIRSRLNGMPPNIEFLRDEVLDLIDVIRAMVVIQAVMR